MNQTKRLRSFLLLAFALMAVANQASGECKMPEAIAKYDYKPVSATISERFAVIDHSGKRDNQRCWLAIVVGKSKWEGFALDPVLCKSSAGDKARLTISGDCCDIGPTPLCGAEWEDKKAVRHPVGGAPLIFVPSKT